MLNTYHYIKTKRQNYYSIYQLISILIHYVQSEVNKNTFFLQINTHKIIKYLYRRIIIYYLILYYINTKINTYTYSLINW